MAERRRQVAEAGRGGCRWEWWKRAVVLATAGWAAAVMLVQGLVSISPEIYWDISPLIEIPSQVRAATALGPRGMMVLMVLGMLGGAAGLAACSWAGGRVQWGWVILAAVGTAVAGYQMGRDGGSLFRGASWLGAIFPALAIGHLAGWAEVRRLLVACLAGLAVSLAGQAFIYLWIEHPQTVAYFLAHEREAVAGHGWAWGSVQHEVFKRRLMSSEPAGPFGLSNVYASVLGAVSMVGLGAGAAVGVGLRGWTAWKRGLACVGLVAIGLVAVVALVLTRSKGGVGAGVVGAAGVCGLVWWGRKMGWGRGAVAGAVVAAAIAAPVVVVLVRGAVVGVPADASGERSLLFRYFYWEATGRLMREGGLEQWMVGMGPGGFKTAFAGAKRAICPEDVTSVHNVFLDYLVMLGVGGVAWGALLVLWLWEAGRWAVGERGVKTSGAGNSRDEGRGLELAVAAAVGGVCFGVAYLVQWPAMTVERAALLVVGVVVLVGAVRILGHVEGGERWVMAGLFGGALVLMVHGQIDMTFFHQGAAGLAWGVMGLAAGSGGGEREVGGQIEGAGRWRKGGCVVAIVFGLGAGVLGVIYGVPVIWQQAYLARAAEAAQRGELGVAEEQLRRAIEVLEYDARPYQYRVMVLTAAAQVAVGEGRRRVAERLLEEARGTVEMALRRGLGEPMILGTGAQVEELMGRMLGWSEAWERALELWRLRVQYQPWNVQVRRGLADLLWRMGRLEEARQEYRRCLELSEQAYLDPLVQLSEEGRREIQGRLEGGP